MENHLNAKFTKAAITIKHVFPTLCWTKMFDHPGLYGTPTWSPLHCRHCPIYHFERGEGPEGEVALSVESLGIGCKYRIYCLIFSLQLERTTGQLMEKNTSTGGY